MKLSQAILKGSEGVQQSKHGYREGEAVCALGAAYKGITGKLPPLGYEAIDDEWYVMNVSVNIALDNAFPELNANDKKLFRQIAALNDFENKTFKEIADFVAEQGY